MQAKLYKGTRNISKEMSQYDELVNMYNPDGSDLRNLQLRMLEILNVVDRICRKHDIKYWLCGVTLLGAVRHGGFIPWDDDLDIEMMREDFIRFSEIIKDELPDNLILHTSNIDPKYVYLYAKVRDVNSYVKEKCPVNQSFKYQGAFVDVFPREYALLSWCKIAAKLYNRLCFNLVLGTGFRFFLYVVFRKALVNIVFPLFRVFSKFSNKRKICHTYGVGFYDAFESCDIFPLIEVNFEGGRYYAPNNCHVYLTKLYGDYMHIPEKKEIHVENNLIKLW